MADVVKLRCNACQDFLKLIIKPDWQQTLYNIAQDKVTNKNSYKDKYVPAYEKMRDIGVENYSIDYMDVTFISEILHRCKDIAFAQNKTIKTMEQLTVDRNLTNHSNENEDAEELYLRGLLALCNLRNFIRTVDRYETSIDDTKRQAYREKYITEISGLMDLLDYERIDLIHKTKMIDMDIQRVLDSENPFATFCEISHHYFDRLKIYKNMDEYDEFMVRASDAGIEYAHSGAALYFFRKENYLEAENKLFKVFQFNNEPYEMHFIIDEINLYLKKGNQLTDGMKQLIAGIVERGYPVEEMLDGHYQWKRRTEHENNKSSFI